MTHARTTIRTKFVDLLGAALVVAAGRVYHSRTIEILDTELPALNVTTEAEESSESEICGGRLERLLDVVVSITAAETENEDIADTLDGLAEDVEDVFSGKPQLDLPDQVSGLTLIATTAPELAVAGDRTVGKLSLTYRVTYFA